MLIDESKAAGHEHECASCQGVGGSDPGSLARLCDAERGSDMEATAHAGPEGDHGYEFGQDGEDGEGDLATLGQGVGIVICFGSWRGRWFLRRYFFF